MARWIVGLTVESRMVEIPANSGARTCVDEPTNCCPAEECCPGIEIPETLYLTFHDMTGDCDCLVSATLVYDDATNAWVGVSEDCVTTLTLMLECDAGTWVLTDDCGNTWTSQTEDCDPFALVFCTTIADGCPCTGDVCATISDVPKVLARCCDNPISQTLTGTHSVGTCACLDGQTAIFTYTGIVGLGSSVFANRWNGTQTPGYCSKPSTSITLDCRYKTTNGLPDGPLDGTYTPNWVLFGYDGIGTLGPSASVCSPFSLTFQFTQSSYCPGGPPPTITLTIVE